MIERVTAAAVAAAADASTVANQRIEPALTDSKQTATTEASTKLKVSDEKPSLPVLLCFLAFFAYCFIAWYVTSRVERYDLPELAQLVLETNEAVSQARHPADHRCTQLLCILGNDMLTLCSLVCSAAKSPCCSLSYSACNPSTSLSTTRRQLRRRLSSPP